MRVYVFGNKLLFFVVMYGLYRIVLDVKDFFGLDVIDFVLKYFYVDDGLIFVFIEK